MDETNETEATPEKPAMTTEEWWAHRKAALEQPVARDEMSSEIPRAEIDSKTHERDDSEYINIFRNTEMHRESTTRTPLVPFFIDDDDVDLPIPTHYHYAGWREVLGALPGETIEAAGKRLADTRARGLSR